ncbi:MAG: hypothetical protein PUE12_11195 [Oscillospiraceae bacterium]|nr:hypothetical protein [Oscillospiraceae bacterium]
MRNLITANYMLKLAIEKAQKGDIDKAIKFTKIAFKDIPEFSTAERLACAGVVKVYNDARSELKNNKGE